MAEDLAMLFIGVASVVGIRLSHVCAVPTSETPPSVSPFSKDFGECSAVPRGNICAAGGKAPECDFD